MRITNVVYWRQSVRDDRKADAKARTLPAKKRAGHHAPHAYGLRHCRSASRPSVDDEQSTTHAHEERQTTSAQNTNLHPQLVIDSGAPLKRPTTNTDRSEDHRGWRGDAAA